MLHKGCALYVDQTCNSCIGICHRIWRNRTFDGELYKGVSFRTCPKAPHIVKHFPLLSSVGCTTTFDLLKECYSKGRPI